jgi:hypothetical protein
MVTVFVVSASFFSAARFLSNYQTKSTSSKQNKTNLLSTQHLGESFLRILQKHFMNGRLCFQFAQSLDAVHDTFIGILVNLCRDKLGLTNSNDRGHYKHRLSRAKVVRISVNRERTGRRQTSARNVFDATSSLVFSLKRRTSLVKAVDRTEPV